MRAVRHAHLMRAAGVVPARTDATAVPARTARQRRPQTVPTAHRREAALEEVEKVCTRPLSITAI